MRILVKIISWVGGVLLAVGLILYATMFDVWTVPSDDPQLAVAVEPTLTSGDLILVTRHATTSYGTLVRCTDPDSPARFIVGRVVGMSRDIIELKQEVLSVNRRHEPYVGRCEPPVRSMRVPATQEQIDLNCQREEFAGTEHEILSSADHFEGEVHAVVEEGRVYLLSDNHHLHLDSRDYGQINGATCQHIVYRLWGAAGMSHSPGRRFTFLW